MDNLMIERDQKKVELAAKEADLARLEQELAGMEDKDYQVELIEEALATQYAEFQKSHPIDRSQEPEIASTIKEKDSAVSIALKIYNDRIASAKKRWSDNRANRYEPTFRSYVYGETWAQRQKREEKFYRDQSRARTKRDKENEKEYNDSCKVAAKTCIDELKRLFGELEIDIKRFYKNGISKENLDRLVAIMDKIYVEGSKIGTIPLSYQQKVYKWQQTAKDLPVDEEKQNQAKENAKNKRFYQSKPQSYQKSMKLRKKYAVYSQSKIKTGAILQN